MISPQSITDDFSNHHRLQNIYKMVSSTAISSDYIDSIYIYSEKNNSIITTNGGGELDKFYDNSWYADYSNKKHEGYFWVQARKVESMAKNIVTHNYISIFRAVYLYNKESTGAVVINIDAEKLGKLINNTDKNMENIYIIDESGRILYNRDISIINKKYGEIAYLKDIQFDKNNNQVIKEIDGVKVSISFTSSSKNEWKFVSLLPLDSYSQKTSYLRLFMIAAIIASLLVSVALSFFISLRVYRPIKDIIAVIENPEKWLFMQKKNGQSTKDEFKYIAGNIINTFDYKQKIEEELAQRLLLLKNAQAVALQSQINPHLLHNTLETIKWKAIGLTDGENDTSRMVTLLSELLRLSLESEDKLIVISDELKHAKDYVEIQKYRYNDRFDVNWNFHDELMEYKIIKITFQPIIENAIYHGIKPLKRKGFIKVEGVIMEDMMTIEISDNGMGMSQEEVGILNTDMQENYIKEDEHIGLRNVNQRIKLIFGEKFGLTVESKEGEGTIVKILVPLVK